MGEHFGSVIATSNLTNILSFLVGDLPLLLITTKIRNFVVRFCKSYQHLKLGKNTQVGLHRLSREE
jgi:hypothetical protein